MAVLTISDKLAPNSISYDSRFRAWGKLVAQLRHIDLSKTNGYALTGPFIAWGKNVAVSLGQFVVLAAESGSWARHSYDYALIRVNADGLPEVVPADEVKAAVEAAPDWQKAAALNSTLYAYALFCYQELQSKGQTQT